MTNKIQWPKLGPKLMILGLMSGCSGTAKVQQLAAGQTPCKITNNGCSTGIAKTPNQKLKKIDLCKGTWNSQESKATCKTICSLLNKTQCNSVILCTANSKSTTCGEIG